MTDETQGPREAQLPAKMGAIEAGGDLAPIIPRNLDDMFRLANALARSGLAPKGMETPEKVLVSIMAGAELGLNAFQAVQSFAIINGRATIWGDGALAVVRRNGTKVKEWLEGEGDGMVAFCEVTRPDTGEVIQRKFSVADAKKAGLWSKANTPWQTYPRRMLQMLSLIHI